MDAVGIGMRALAVAMRETTGTAVTPDQLTATFIPVGIGVLIVFIAAPALLSATFGGIAADAIEAASRAAMLLVYLLVLSRTATTQRLFSYHGAEHMAIAAHERHGRLPTETEVAAESPVHSRCGTNFIALFVITAGVVYSFVPRSPWWFGGSARILLVPVVAAAAYEVMRFAARSRGAAFLSFPGRAMQRITTRYPKPDQIEIALASLTEAVSPGR